MKNLFYSVVRKTVLFVFLSGMTFPVCAQLPVCSWIDSVAMYGFEQYRPVEKYIKWDWAPATLVQAAAILYREAPSERKNYYLDYIRGCTDKTISLANGRTPNAMAPAFALPFLSSVLHDPVYEETNKRIWEDYLHIPRTPNNGVSHRWETLELWDDTIFMLSMYLFEMYRLTGDICYLEEFVEQFYIHDEALVESRSGLWVHGWDPEDDDYRDRCSQFGWQDPQTGRSREFWGRGNGWIAMALADALEVIPRENLLWQQMADALQRFVRNLPKWQDPKTGLWYQLPVYMDEDGNFLESSCSAMFAYGMTIGLKHKVLDEAVFRPVVDRAYVGLRKHATESMGGAYLAPSRVCIGTCLGDKAYYFSRQVSVGEEFAIASYIRFGLAYEKLNGLR